MNSTATKALAVTGQVLKYTMLTFAWLVQYCFYIPFIGLPFALLRKGGKAAMVILACTFIGLPIVILYLLLRNRPEPKEHRSMWKPWGIK